jgi:hypothetical protein
VHPLGLINTPPEPNTPGEIMTNTTIQWTSRAGVDYEIYKAPDSGLMVVYADGAKIGQTQTEAGAKLIRRNHARNIERRMV